MTKYVTNDDLLKKRDYHQEMIGVALEHGLEALNPSTNKMECASHYHINCVKKLNEVIISD
jgi:hypothetical protein